MKFSIIIPVYNVASYLRECLDSVLTQDCQDFEVICVDDGSTDESSSILDEYGAGDRRIKVVHKSNGGVSSARNVGLDVAEGDWVWFVDADDAIHPEALVWLSGVVTMCESAETICFTTERESSLDGVNWPSLPRIGCVSATSIRNSDAFRMHRRAVWGVVAKRNAIADTKFKPYTIGEDALFHLTLFWKVRQWVLVPASLYYYRTRSSSAVNRRPTKRAVFDLFRSEMAMLGLWRDHRCEWERNLIEDFIRWNRDFVWYTFNGMFFKLSANDRKALLGDWLRVQDMHRDIFGENFYRRMSAVLIRFFNSQFLCRLLVLGPCIVRKHIRI